MQAQVPPEHAGRGGVGTVRLLDSTNLQNYYNGQNTSPAPPGDDSEQGACFELSCFTVDIPEMPPLGPYPIFGDGSLLFDSFSMTSMAATMTTLTHSTCRHVVLTASEFASQLVNSVDINGPSISVSVPGALGDALSACGNIAGLLNDDSNYVIGSVASSGITVCAAIDPCTETFLFGLNGVKVSVNVVKLDVDISLTAIAYAKDTSKLSIDMSNVWTSGSGAGTYADFSLSTYFVAMGSIASGIGIKQADTTVITLVGNVDIQVGVGEYKINPILGVWIDCPSCKFLTHNLAVVGHSPLQAVLVQQKTRLAVC
eukprot:362936-Chlamydomonas_euryale.AAC.2